MEKAVVKPAWQRAVIRLSAVACTAIVIGGMYWAREVFIPLALGVFFAYVLSPVVAWVQRRGLGRVPAVVVVATVAALMVGGTFYFVARQLTGMSNELLARKDTIKQNLTDTRVRLFGDGESQFGKMLEEFEQAISPTPAPAGSVEPPKADPNPTAAPPAKPADTTAPPTPAVQTPKPSWAQRLQGLATPAGEMASLVAFAFILVVFILLAKEDIQDRILRVVSGGKVTSATRATRDAGQRIGRYLLSQLIVNTAFGVILTVVMILPVRTGPDGHAAPMVGYAFLWGFIAFVMRYVPYLGTWIGVVLPVGYAFVTMTSLEQEWWVPVVVFVAYIGLELFSNNFVEPRLYGTSMGISELALLMSAAFWAFLWGPIGLILSGPLTTCLLMLGKYHKEFRGLYVLLGTDPPLARGTALYQRITAGNADEAVRVVEPAIHPDSPTAVYDDAVVPALSLLKQARTEGEYDAEDEQRVLGVAGEVIDELTDRANTSTGKIPADRTKVLLSPVRDEIDGLASTGFAATLNEDLWETVVTPPAALTSELTAEVGRFGPKAVVLAGVWPVSGTHLRYLCKRVRAAAPDVYIVVAVWGREKADEVSAPLLAAGANAVEFTMTDTRSLLSGWRPVFEKGGEPPALDGKPSNGVGTANADRPAEPRTARAK